MKKVSVFIATLMMSGFALGQVGTQPGQQDFDTLDADSDGSLDQQEMRVQSGDQQFSDIDSDADGEVSREEFRTFSTSQPGQMQGDDQSEPSLNDTDSTTSDPATTTVP